ncbi:hypothetical protein ACRXB1_14415, partial [Caballeronia sp. M23-90]
MAMTIAVPREIRAGERRVAATPETVGQLLKLGFAVNVESQAGLAASFDDDAYRKALGSRFFDAYVEYRIDFVPPYVEPLVLGIGVCREMEEIRIQ